MFHIRIVQKLGLLATSCLVLGISPALGQSGPTARAGGLFGDTRSDTADRHRLNVTVSLSGGVDSELPLEFVPQVARVTPQSGGSLLQASATASYARTQRRARIAGTAETAFRYFGRVGEIDPASHSLGFGASIDMPARGTLEVNQSAAYSPSYVYQLFPSLALPQPGDTIPVALDYRFDHQDSLLYRSSASLAFGAASRTRVTFGGSYSRTDFQQQPTRSDLDFYSARGKVAQGVGRSGRVSLEYEYRKGRFSYGTASAEHRVPIRVDYSPALSSSRRLVLDFTVTPSVLAIPASQTVATIPASGAMRQTRYKLLTSASASYPFLRSWEASMIYARNLEYLAVLGEPVFADQARAQLKGLPSRRLDVLATAAYADGDSALSGGRRLEALTVNLRGRLALTRGIAVLTEYLYHRYDFRGQQSVGPGLPSRFEQHGLRVGFVLWTSVF